MKRIELNQEYIRSRSAEVESGCWEWIGATKSGGYGYINRSGKNTLAHRLSFFLWNGHWPEVCRHKCDNRKCVNPERLEDGTHADNVRDRVERGRSRHPRNEEHGRTKFTDELVARVRPMRESGMTQQAIADELGMAQSHVSRILRGENRT